MISWPPTSSVSPSSSIGSQLLDDDKDEGVVVVVVGVDVEDGNCSNCNTTTSLKQIRGWKKPTFVDY